MIEAGLSIRDRTGRLDHNLRLTKRKDKNGNFVVMKRRHIDSDMSRYNVVLEQADPDPFMCVERVYRETMTDALDKFNREQIEKGHPERVRTIESYMADIETSYYRDKKRNPPLYHEKVIKVGDRSTMPSFCFDNEGNKVLSPEGKKSIEILTAYYHAFKTRNPNMRIVLCCIHADERGAVHMHLDYIPFGMDYKRGLRVRNSMSTALKEQYATVGKDCNNQRYDNALIRWTKEQRDIVTKIAGEYGVRIIDMQSDKREYLSDKEYRAVMRKIEAGGVPEIDLPVGQVQRLIGKRSETADEYQKRVLPIVRDELKRRSDAERFYRMRAETAEAKLVRMEKERETEQQRLSEQIDRLRDKDAQHRYSLKVNEVAQKEKELDQLIVSASNKIADAERKAERIITNANTEATNIVSVAKNEVDSIVDDFVNSSVGVRKKERIVLELLQKQNPDMLGKLIAEAGKVMRRRISNSNVIDFGMER